MILSVGRLRLVTKPSLTGSSPVANTIGIVAAIALAAAMTLFPAMSTATGRRTRSATSAGIRFVLILRPAVLDRDVLAFDISGTLQTLAHRSRIAKCNDPKRTFGLTNV